MQTEQGDGSKNYGLSIQQVPLGNGKNKLRIHTATGENLKIFIPSGKENRHERRYAV